MLTQKYLGTRGKSEKSVYSQPTLLYCSLLQCGKKWDKAFGVLFKGIALLLYLQIKPDYFSKSLPFMVLIQLRSTLEIQNSSLVVIGYHSHLSCGRMKCSSGCQGLRLEHLSLHSNSVLSSAWK